MSSLNVCLCLLTIGFSSILHTISDKATLCLCNFLLCCKITILLNSLLFFSFDLGEIIANDYKTPYVLITSQ